MTTVGRDRKIDIMRFIATIGIIIAHVNAPSIFMQLRNFDVPLMALLMGMSYYLSSKNKSVDYLEYVKKRFKVLVIPTWKFLTMFFVLVFLASRLLDMGSVFSWSQIIRSYALLDGIGYVWVIRVFLTVALLNPIILKFSNQTERNYKYFSVLGVIYVSYLALTILNGRFDGRLSLLFGELILNSIGYGIVAAVGVRFNKLTKKNMLVAIVASFTIYIGLGFVNGFALTNIAKYPPTTYYLSYAFGCIFLIYLLLKNKYVFKLFDNKLVYFVSENSLWFYLWHIIPVYSLYLLEAFIPVFANSFIVRGIYVFIVALIFTLIQNKVKKIIKKRHLERKK